MTVIAWDGRTLAADKRVTVAGMAYSVTKIHRVRGHLVGFSGSGGHVAALLKWFERNGPPEDYPKRPCDDAAGMLVLDPKGRILMYSPENNLPELLEAPFFARGAGRDYAMAAMYLGKSAHEAVAVACVFKVGCGNGTLGGVAATVTGSGTWRKNDGIVVVSGRLTVTNRGGGAGVATLSGWPVFAPAGDAALNLVLATGIISGPIAGVIDKNNPSLAVMNVRSATGDSVATEANFAVGTVIWYEFSYATD